jgi:hypothetical protein
MNSGMAKTRKPEPHEGAEPPRRVRMIFDTEEVIRKAVGLRALKDDADLQDIINAALRAYLGDEIEEVKRFGRP